MPVTIVAGAQWGDEGKGKVVDVLAQEADLVIRAQGGPNAGHTVVNDDGKFVLHSVPSGIFSKRAQNLIGAGTVINPKALVAELKGLVEAGIDIDRLYISERAHLILPYHIALDCLEEQRKGESSLGTTGQGVGPAYADKASRVGFRMGDLLDLQRFKKMLQDELTWKNRILGLYGHTGYTVDEILDEIEPAAQLLAPRVIDTIQPVSEALASGKQILLEGQLGVMRDLDWGAYPYVTSSSPTPAGIASAAGISPKGVDRVIGVVKAYITAVGAGPFPTELASSESPFLREKGDEYGATTHRPRRCGWYDAVAVDWSIRLAGFTELILTKLDILSGLDCIPMGVSYQKPNQQPIQNPYPTSTESFQPIYEQLPGWSEEISDCRLISELPENARAYVTQIEQRAGIPISMISNGPHRNAVVQMSKS